MSAVSTVQRSPFSFSLPSDWKDRVSEIAHVCFRYLALTFIGVSSAYFLGQNAEGRFFILFTGVMVLSSALSCVVSTLNPSQTFSELMSKTDFAARVILWSLLIVGALVAGIGGGYLLSGASFLITGIQGNGIIPILYGLADITFTLGYVIPAAQFCLRHSAFLYKGWPHVQKKLEQTMEVLKKEFASQNVPFLEAVELAFARIVHAFSNDLNFNTLVEVADHLPESVLRRYFKLNLPYLTVDQILDITQRFPTTFTVDFLIDCLPDYRNVNDIQKILQPRLTCPFNIQKLQEIEQGIEIQEAQLLSLQEQKQKGIDHEILSKAIEKIFGVLIGYTNQVNSLQKFIKSFPTKHAQSQYVPKIDLPALKDSAKTVFERINALRTSLEKFRTTLTIQEEEENFLTEPDQAPVILGSYGFTLPDFHALGRALGCEDTNAEAVCNYIQEKGLSSRNDFIQHHIFDRAHKEELTIDLLTQRIVDFCEKGKPVHLSASSQASPPSVTRPSRWAVVAIVVNNLFYICLSTSLVLIQAFYQPIPTVIGFTWRLFKNSMPSISRLYSPPPDFARQGINDHIREIYLRISTTVYSFELGMFGAFFASSIHAQAILYYGNRLIRRL